MNEKIIARFWRRVDKNGPVMRPELGPCWIWKRPQPNGYGRFWLRKGVQKLATHISLRLIGIEVPKGFHACHKCDNPPCVNPDHLVVGTPAENIRDGIRRGRRAHIRGETANNAVLTEAHVIEIRERAAKGEFAAKLASEFGVVKGTIYHVCSGRSWKHASGPLTKKGRFACRKLSIEQAEEIRQRMSNGEPVSRLGPEYGVETTTLYGIYHGVRYRSDKPLPTKVLTKRKFNDLQARAIALQYSNGKRVCDLVREFSVSRGVVYRTLREQLPAEDLIRKKLSSLQMREIALQYSTGRSVCDLVREFTTSRNVIYRILRERLPIRDSARKKLTPLQAKEIVLQYAAGKRVYDLVRKFSTSRSVVYRILRKHRNHQFCRSPAKSQLPPTPNVCGT